jgi:drug/metabolite transporter (DMT)-like permease
MTTLCIATIPSTHFHLSGKAIGIAAALGAVAIWAGWIVATRHAVGHSLEPAAVGLLRFATPALVFAPVWWRTGVKPKGLSWPMMAALLGFGAPFFLIAGYAMQFAPAPDVAPLLSGAMPLIVALVAMRLGERFGVARKLGLGLIAVGIVAIVGFSAVTGTGAWRGHLLLLGAAGMWAVYTLAFKRSGLTAIEAAAFVAVWSTIILLPLGLPALVRTVAAGHAVDVIVQATVQGVLSGVLAIVLYGVAITRLGATRGAALTALVPVLAAALSVPLLGEWPTSGTVCAITATTFGVMLAAGVLDGCGLSLASQNSHKTFAVRSNYVMTWWPLDE